MDGRSAPRRVVLTGSECTGKTTLARDLAAALDTVWVPEHARAYAEAKGSPLDVADVAPIARGQMRAEDEGVRRGVSLGRELIVLDTDLVSTLVYARHYYDDAPAWIEAEARARRGSLYLLCDIDLPWVPDAARDRPHHRAELQGRFIEALERLDAPWVTIAGAGPARLARAAALVAERLADAR